jgi:Cd2+/Zn2+-exporting ATPase
MLTGDNETIAKSVCEELGIKKYFANLSPIDKEEKVKEIIKNEAKSEKTIFVGDGINDAPVIAGADVGIAMGALGQDAAIEVADVVLMKDSVSDICKAIEISQKTMRIAYQNIVFAIFVKVLVLILSAFGYAPMWLAVFADVGVTILCVLNAIRTLKI